MNYTHHLPFPTPHGIGDLHPTEVSGNQLFDENWRQLTRGSFLTRLAFRHTPTSIPMPTPFLEDPTPDAFRYLVAAQDAAQQLDKLLDESPGDRDYMLRHFIGAGIDPSHDPDWIAGRARYRIALDTFFQRTIVTIQYSEDGTVPPHHRFEVSATLDAAILAVRVIFLSISAHMAIRGTMAPRSIGV